LIYVKHKNNFSTYGGEQWATINNKRQWSG
jgi:hypothetical protein